jgi:hypothetical protein
MGTSWSDILGRTGFQSENTLMPLVRCWEKMLELLQPSLCIADYSPVLCLVNYRTRPTLNVGFGFIVPPTDQPKFPPLMPDKPPFMSDEAVLAVIQTVQTKRQQPLPETLPQLFADAEPFLTVLPELDHYQAFRPSGHLGPMAELLPPQPWPDTPRYFAYLKGNNSATEAVVTALSGFAGQVFVLEPTPKLRERLAQLKLDLLDRPPPLNEMLPQVRVVVHHGGINVAQQALAAGRPQLVFPEHMEAALTAARLHRLGVAHYMMDRYPVPTIVEGLRQLMQEPTFAERARQVAEQVHASGPWNPLPKILDRCRELLG